MEIQINIDCSDADALRAFYCAALGYLPREQMGNYRSCVPPECVPGNTLVFQQVPEAKVAKNRVHLDLIVDDIEAEATRWVALGATRASVQPVCEGGGCWIVMLDPEGNEICLCDS